MYSNQLIETTRLDEHRDVGRPIDAFDLLDHNILLYKLKYYGINSNSLQLLENYLTNRKQYIEFEKHKSDFKTLP